MRLDQRSVHREVLAGEQMTHLRQVENAGEELRGDVAVEQPVAVLAEHRRIPHRIVRRQADEPAEQQIVVELLHQLPFRTHGVERLQQQCPQQALRRDRRPPVTRIETLEAPRQVPQCRVHQFADRPQRMVRRDPALQTHVAEKTFRPLIFAAHHRPQSKGIRQCTESHSNRLAK
jgi:hypothetical protein